MDFSLSLAEWAKDKPLSILQLDPADRAVLKIADERDAIQKKTFTKWLNKHLKKHWRYLETYTCLHVCYSCRACSPGVNRHIEDLFEDLRDGHNLISLLEVLSGELLPRERGRMRFHQLQNVQMALDFLKNRNIKLVNIRPEDIVDANPKLTLGLIWTIILHFQVDRGARMLNIDPLLFQPKVIRMSTTSSIGLPGQHIIRTTEFSNSQVMTGTAAQIHNEANNNILNTNAIDTAGEFASRGRDFGNRSAKRDFRNFNEMELTDSVDQETSDRDLEAQQWSAEMYWSGEGDVSDYSTLERLSQQNSASIMSFQSNLSSSTASASFHSQLSEQSESKEEVINSMLNKVRSHNKVEASKILLAMSNSVENCLAMRQCGVLPLLIQLLHSPDENSNTYHMVHAKRVNFEIRERARQVLHNIVFSQPDDKKGRREARVLRLLEQIRDYCDQLRNLDAEVDDNRNSRCVDQHLGPAVAALMKLSFDEDHRHAMCQLGGLQAIAELLQIDHEVHGCTSDQYCITIRRYSGMALTNLTFGDGANKALLCSMRPFMEALVAQLYSPSEDLRQVTASVLRNLSWRADPDSKRILRDVGAVTILVKAAMEAEKESTLKSILSALWNLSAHCSANKADICLVDGALAFLVSTLTYKSKSKTLAIVENGGGILRNVSSHIAIQNDYRIILRKHNCLQILLQHLKSPSLTVVSNACGTLWNLSARNAQDQRALWEMGAVGMLKKLINSKHKMISMGSSAALKNLLSAKPPGVALGLCVHNDGYKGSAEAPSLHIRKEKALSTEIDQNLAETYDNTDSPKTSPSHRVTNDKNNRVRRHISPSARYMTAQKQKNDLLSLQNRAGVNDEKLTYVVEEKHNGAFQVTKNAKQAMNYKQGQNRLSGEFKDSTEDSSILHHVSDSSLVDKDYESLKLRSARPDGQIFPSKSPHTTQFRSQSPPKHTAENSSPQLGVRKDYKGSDRMTNVAQKSRNICRDTREQIQERSSPKHVVESSGIPKPVHESRIPLPKSCSKLDAQRSQSASPIPQKRGIPQRQENPQITSSSRHLDVSVTQPKHAWSSNWEKEDNVPENLVGKIMIQQPSLPQPRMETNLYKPLPSDVPPVEDFSYGSEDEVKIYQTENTPLNYSLNCSMNDLEEVGASSRCSLNIKTCTNVKLMNNHPLLANVGNNRVDEDSSRLFEFRHGSRDYRNFEGGKTIDFSVQSDYDIDENLSMMSRSSSVASISSFDQQSFHDDESFASDLSRHTSGIESPSELSDSPCQTVPSSPQKVTSSYAGSNSSDAQQTKLSAPGQRQEAAEREPSISDSVDGSCYQNAETGINEDEIQEATDISQERSSFKPTDRGLTADVTVKNNTVFKESELVVKVADDSCTSSSKSVQKLGKVRSLDDDKLRVQCEEPSSSEPTLSAEFVTCASELGSCSSIEGETMDDISPIERAMLEKCIRAGLPQNSLEPKTQGVRQKVPQLSYQLLRDTAEKHPKACSFETDRSTSLKSLELKENEYESHSENEEKGKEDERKAEKKRLFRIPESPVDKKASSEDSNKSDYSPADEKNLHQTDSLNSYNIKVLVDQKGNRRNEKQDRHIDKVKSKQNSSSTIPSQLDFLMTSKKVSSSAKSSDQDDKREKESARHFKAQGQIRSNSNEMSDLDLNKNQNDGVVDQVCKKDCSEETMARATPPVTELTMRHNAESDVADTVTEKDIHFFEKENNGDTEESMLSSSFLCEAREIAEALLGARIGSTEDMTVSTLSCLSDIDNARPPSVMGDMGSLSMTNSSTSEENLKIAVTKECQKILGKTSNKQMPSSKKSLLRELQIGRLNTDHSSNDFSKSSNDSPENLSMKSCSSDLLGNVNPPSILDDMSLTASTGSLNGIDANDSECDSEKVVAPYPSKQDSSMSERMHDAAAMAQLYAKELSNITGNCIKESASNDALSRIKTQQSGIQEVMEVTIADVTEIGCDTIGSDTELEDDLPCDDEDIGSDTLQAPFRNSLSKEETGEGSTENLTLTLTEEPPRADLSPYFDFSKNNGCFMTADEFKALQENADMILNTLRDAEISDDEDDEEHCGMSTGDMLEDETMSLVSNESDEEFLSPDGSVQNHIQKHSPRGDYVTSQVCNGMIALPQTFTNAPSKNSSKKTSLPQMSAKRSSGFGLTRPEDITSKNRYSYPGQITSNNSNFSGSPKRSIVPPKTNQMSENYFSKIRPPVSNRHSAELNASVDYSKTPEEEYPGGFDSRTFTRKKSTVPKGMIPSIQSGPAPPTVSLRSPSSHNIPSLPGSSESIASSRSPEPSKVITSKIAAVWKNGKVRSKSMVDANRNSKLKLEKSASTGSTKDEKFGAHQSERSPSQTPSPQSPLSRSSTYEKLNDEDSSSFIRRPSTLPLSQKTTGSPRHAKTSQQRPAYASIQQQRQTAESMARPPRTIPKTDIVSPTAHQNSSSIPKFQNKAQPSLIPNRRSMIPTPAKFDMPD